MENLEFLMRLNYVPKFKKVAEQCYIALYKDGKRISPYVREISLDPETGLFLVKDVTSLNDDLNCDIYFYMDRWGFPKGFAWSSLVDYFVDVETPFENCDILDQENYEAFLDHFAGEVNEELKKREESKKKNAQTMVMRFGEKTKKLYLSKEKKEK